MYAKKVAFSFFTVPALGKSKTFIHKNKFLNELKIVLAHQGYEFQMRRKLDKENEAKRR